uniref:NADH-ubiquinone oxidoreductase chain 2 n=1 Tax=Himacerus nodipes TaxID=1041166 RepID=K7NBB1_9HEMI|nr:NADH dehydrogenase subunit 2 [Himacerus nodipes]
MFKNMTNLLFLTITILSVMIVLNSNNWISMWMGLEMNLMAFIPLISKSNNHLMAESNMMYFLMQSMGSLILLITVMSNNMLMMINITVNNYLNMILLMSLAIKLGMPPFHFWFPEMMSKMNWYKCYILMTWQKVAPMTIMSMIYMEKLMLLLILMSVMVGAIGGLNQTSMRKIMAYSSINHSGWMMSCMYMHNNSWLLYMVLYSIMLLPIITWMTMYNMYMLNQMKIMTNTIMDKLNMSVMFMSLGGLPPFMGFFPKWMVIQYMIDLKMYHILLIMVMFSLLTLFYYMRMISPLLMINFTINKWLIKFNSPKLMSTIMFMVNMSMPLLMYINLY